MRLIFNLLICFFAVSIFGFSDAQQTATKGSETPKKENTKAEQNSETKEAPSTANIESAPQEANTEEDQKKKKR